MRNTLSNRDLIPIFFSADNNYVPFLSVAVMSASKNASPLRNYKVLILHDGITEENQRKIKTNEKENFKIDFVLMEKGLEKITNRESNYIRCEHFTLTIYFRLFIADMFPEYKKGIYIDGDVVVLSDLAELYDTDIGDNYLGACNDLSVIDVPIFTDYMVKHVGVDKTKYINSGVLLMNLEKMRKNNFSHHFLSLLDKYHFESVAPDQDYINAICNGSIHYLSKNWNTMPNNNIETNKEAKLIHYNLFSKPWCVDTVQYSDIFWSYAKDCGYYSELLQIKEKYNEEEAEKEKKILANMLKRASEIPVGEVTFKNIESSGVKIKL